jgi:hypothetical protein
MTTPGAPGLAGFEPSTGAPGLAGFETWVERDALTTWVPRSGLLLARAGQCDGSNLE